MEAYQFKINLYLVQERPVLKKNPILWGLRSKGMVFFPFFSLNTYFLAHREMSLSSPFMMPVPRREKSPSTSNEQASHHWVASGQWPTGWESCST